MVDKFRSYLKKSFSNSPKAKIMLALAMGICCLTVIIVSTRKTVSIDLNGEIQKLVTSKRTVKDALQENGYELTEKDKVQPSLDSKISDKDTISIKQAVQVKVVIAGEELEILTAENTIGEMLLAELDYLKSQGIDYKDSDIVSPSKDTVITSNMNIQVINVKEEEVKDIEEIPFETEQTIDYNKANTYREVTQQGAAGTKEVAYKVVMHDNQVIAKTKISETPLTEPQTQCITVGGAIEKTDRNQQKYLSKKTLYVQATAYTGGGLTATGREVVYNPGGMSTIAVDPRVIPLGSLVEVEGYGLAIASDTGGAIKGNIIDVYLNSESECQNWGRKYNVEVNIRAYPGEW